MRRMTLAIVTAAPLVLGLGACSEQDAERAGERVEKTLKNVSESALNAAEKAGDKIEEWTDRGSAEEPKEAKQAGATDRRAQEEPRAPGNKP